MEDVFILALFSTCIFFAIDQASQRFYQYQGVRKLGFPEEYDELEVVHYTCWPKNNDNQIITYCLDMRVDKLGLVILYQNLKYCKLDLLRLKSLDTEQTASSNHMKELAQIFYRWSIQVFKVFYKLKKINNKEG